MSRTNTHRVYLGAPFDREFWWNTARRILNEKYRGEFDHRFTRNQGIPDAGSLSKPFSKYMVGGTGTPNVALSQVLNYKRASK